MNLDSTYFTSCASKKTKALLRICFSLHIDLKQTNKNWQGQRGATTL